MAWTAHASTDAPVPSWVVHQARITSLHPRLTELTPAMVQVLGQYRDVIAENIMATIDDRIVTRWKRRSVGPGPTRDQPTDPSCQSWTKREQPGTPQQNNFVNTYDTSLACVYIRSWAHYMRCETGKSTLLNSLTSKTRGTGWQQHAMKSRWWWLLLLPLLEK